MIKLQTTQLIQAMFFNPSLFLALAFVYEANAAPFPSGPSAGLGALGKLAGAAGGEAVASSNVAIAKSVAKSAASLDLAAPSLKELNPVTVKPATSGTGAGSSYAHAPVTSDEGGSLASAAEGQAMTAKNLQELVARSNAGKLPAGGQKWKKQADESWVGVHDPEGAYSGRPVSRSSKSSRAMSRSSRSTFGDRRL